MKIAIDVSSIIYETGVSTYTEELVKHLLKIDNKNQYILYGASMRRFLELQQRASVYNKKALKMYPIAPVISEFLWNQVHFLPIDMLIGKTDVFHSSDWYQPKTKAFKVTTVHDLAPILFPKLTHPRIVAAHRRRLNWVKKEVDRVISPSQATKSDLIHFGIKEEKIRVISEAVSTFFKPVSKSEISQVLQKYNIKSKYLFSLGVGGRKNTEKLITALDNLPDLVLVLAGNKPDNFQGYKSERVIFTGHVEKPDLPGLYSGAAALVYPSLYEGFGLPVLEAFACGCPVVASNIPVLSEVSAGAAILVDPNSVSDISDGVKKALKNKESLQKKGFDRLKNFSWTKTASQTLQVYEEYNK